MVCGNCRTGLESALEVSRELCAAIVSVEYRLAPEHLDPAPIEDCYVDRTSTVSPQQNDMELESPLHVSEGFAYGTTLDLASSRTFWGALLGERRVGADVSPYASAARAKGLSGLPKTFIEVGSAELFRDEAVTYATRIWEAGGDAEIHVWPGGYHAYFFYQAAAALSLATVKSRRDWLRRVLRSSVHSGEPPPGPVGALSTR